MQTQASTWSTYVDSLRKTAASPLFADAARAEAQRILDRIVLATSLETALSEAHAKRRFAKLIAR